MSAVSGFRVIEVNAAFDFDTAAAVADVNRSLTAANEACCALGASSDVALNSQVTDGRIFCIAERSSMRLANWVSVMEAESGW